MKPSTSGLPVLLCAALALVGCSLSDRGAAAADSAPQRMVRLPDGRKINLNCSGAGHPTVLLEAGFGASSSAWFKVQPALSRTTRVCSYDRAGYGFSDPGPLPRDGSAIARDLDQALTAGGIAGPFVIVGHSAGGLYARLFAARDPARVKGLVLLDPTVERQAPRPDGDGLDGIRRRLQRCLGVSETSPPPPLTDPQWSGCVSKKSSAHAVEVAQHPETWRGQLSELDSIFGRTSEQILRTYGVLRGVPIYVITASETAATAPKVGFENARSAWELQHEAIAAGAITGSQQTVHSSHMVMLDRPDVVISAVEEMITASRAGRPPAPLPPSEADVRVDTDPAGPVWTDPLKELETPKSLKDLDP